MKSSVRQKASVLTSGAMLLMVVLLAACSLGGNASSLTNPGAPSASGQATATAGAAPLTHSQTPAAKVPGAVSIANDENTQLAANLHWSTSGDVFNGDRFERPFTQKDMTYLPALDIQSLSIGKDPNFYYASLQLAGVDQASQSLNADYGLEIDLNKDGRGDVLIWVHPPFTTDWSVAPVTVYTDPDGDVGGPRPLKSDAPFTGDGYEKTIFTGGQGSDSDLAWVRISPDSPNTLQFAFKPSLLNGTTAFMIGGWADDSIKDPAKFDYNDHFSLTDAGSSMHGDANYPIKALYALDNTCRAAVGFTPNGTEPLVCPLPPAATPTLVPGKSVPTTVPTPVPPK